MLLPNPPSIPGVVLQSNAKSGISARLHGQRSVAHSADALFMWSGSEVRHAHRGVTPYVLTAVLKSGRVSGAAVVRADETASLPH